MNDEAYRIEIVQVGKMDEVPTCAVYALEKIGEYEPFCYTMLILRRYHDDEVVIINTGFPEEISHIRKAWQDWDARCRFERAEDMKVANILAARGIDPLSVRHVFITPWGPYNTGNISLFRNANLYVLKRGWAYLLGLEENLPRLPRHITIPDAELAYLVTDGFEKLVLLPDEAAPLPGISIFYAGVHHPASMAIAINTAQGIAIFSDAFFKFQNIERMKPIGYCQDLRQCMKSYRRIAQEASLLIPMYDPALFERYPRGIIA
ncbi:MAG: hypothetical protein OXG78_15985 [Chloroflexi bacterium]|nr:hypothetical protein [Chloroflexota bacterium]